MAKLIPLTAWAKRHLDPPPSLRTLRSWARCGRFNPPALLIGREYRVSEDARYTNAAPPPTPPPEHVSARVRSILLET